MDIDPDVAAMKRVNRKPLWIGLGAVGGAALLAGLWILNGARAVRASLEADGHSDVEVKIRGPFDYGYTSKKGTMVCGGSITRLPFSTSHQSGCFGTGDPKPKPARPEHEVLARQLREQFPALPIAEARCAPIEPGATKVTCTLESDAGAPLDLQLEKSGGNWKIKTPQRIVPRETLAGELAVELQKKVKAAVTVDCGSGLFGFSEGVHLDCAATRKGAKKAGSIAVTFGDGGSYTFEATGI